jgi:hypothetical protein
MVAGTVRDGVFYTGDGGLKFALTRQFAEGNLHPDLRLPAEAWVVDLWNAGLYPLDRPFAYEIGGQRFVKDPIFFSLLTAPLYAAFGWPGLYVVPVASLWALWAVFILLARRLAVGPVTTSLALAGVVFASPLTLYGGIYWEHTLAVALAFAGIALLATNGEDRAWRAIGGGALVALSAWFRSEHYMLVAVVALLAPGSRRLALGIRRIPLVLAGLLAPMGALVALNLAVYGGPLGAHALQVTEPLGLWVRVANAGATLVRLLTLLIEFFPLAAPAMALGIWVAARKDPVDSLPAPGRMLAWTSGLYAALVPAILPRPETGGDGGKQWGPRFLLVLVPLILALAAMATRGFLRVRSRALRLSGVAVLAATFVSGAYLNAWVGTRALAGDYAGRMLPLLEFLRRDPARLIAASEQFAPQEMMVLAPERRFFFVKSAEDLERLGVAALRHGESRLLFLSDQVVQGSGPIFADGEMLHISIRPIARYGWRLVAHEVRTSRTPLIPPSQPAGH